jgi:2-polyprenyl-3-methyl-5-hydroxy-6-metoxy-1,4-benzoquinol methylase
LSDAKIVESWRKNAAPWTSAVRDNQIESRRLITNSAVIDAVVSRSPTSVLDIGCGEGWLARALAEKGIHVTGVDVTPELVAQARQAGDGDFRVASYEEIAEQGLGLRVDVAVANFSLIGKDAVDALIARVPDLLTPRGSLVVQTLHPVVARGDLPYRDGWRAGSWTGFSEEFTDPAPWYFRTLESWVTLLANCGFSLRELREPLHPATHTPASVIFIAQVGG